MTDLVVCQFLQPCDQFRGIDGFIYPPGQGATYAIGDITTLPREHAVVLAGRGVVTSLEDSTTLPKSRSEPIPPDVRDFEIQHPDFFPADTLEEKKIEYLKTIRGKQHVVEAQHRENYNKLDERTEQAQAERELRDMVCDILKTGNPLEYLLGAFRLNHQGHEEISRAIIYSTVLQSSQTSKGIQISVVGSRGSGKSSAIKSTIHLLPRAYLVESSFSPKALYYSPPPEKTILFIDDIVLNEELISLVKRAMSNFQTETTHSTVIEKKGVLLRIPKRLVFLGSSVWETGDDQLRDRCLNVGIANEQKDDQAYYEFESKRREEGRADLVSPDEVLISRALLEHIKEQEFIVKICPLEFAYTSDRRLMNQFYDLVEASTILNYLQRNHSEKDGIITAIAGEQDILAASDFTMFRILNPASDGRMTRAEVAFDDVIQQKIRDEQRSVVLSESQLVELQGKSMRAVRATLYGRDGSQSHIDGGLFEKCPWYSLTETERGTKEISIAKRPAFAFQNAFARVRS